jgi:hypothetical protein
MPSGIVIGETDRFGNAVLSTSVKNKVILRFSDKYDYAPGLHIDYDPTQYFTRGHDFSARFARVYGRVDLILRDPTAGRALVIGRFSHPRRSRFIKQNKDTIADFALFGAGGMELTCFEPFLDIQKKEDIASLLGVSDNIVVEGSFWGANGSTLLRISGNYDENTRMLSEIVLKQKKLARRST